MKRINKIINNSDFSKNVFTLFTGQLVAQTIAFAVGFVITRLYSPEQLGLYATFVAITTILSIVATGRYDAAIVVEEDDKKISALWLLSFLISVGFNLTLLVVLYFFSDVIFSKFKIIELNKWAVFIPFAVFIGSIIKSTQFYYNKYSSYKWIRNSDIIKSVANSTLSISLFKWLTGGLIFANIIGSAVSLMYLFAKLPQDFWVKIKTIISLPEL